MAAGIGRDTQSAVYRGGAVGRMPVVPAGWNALRVRRAGGDVQGRLRVCRGFRGQGVDRGRQRHRIRPVAHCAKDAARRERARPLGRAVWPTVPLPRHRGSDRRARARASRGRSRHRARRRGPGASRTSRRTRPRSRSRRHSRRRRARRTGSSFTGAARTTWSRASSLAQRPRPRRSSSPWTPTCWDGGPVISTWPTSRSRTVWESRNTRTTPCSGVSSQNELPRPANGPTPKLNAAVVGTFLDMARHYPGSFWANLRSKEPRTAVDVFLEVFSDRRSRGRTSSSCESVRRCRSC